MTPENREQIAASVVGVSSVDALYALRKLAKEAMWAGYDVELHTWAIELGDHRDGIIVLTQRSQEMQQLVLDALGLGDMCSPLYADAFAQRFEVTV